MNKKIEVAARRFADAYREWIMAGAEYNSLVHAMTGPEASSNYTVNFGGFNSLDSDAKITKALDDFKRKKYGKGSKKSV